MLYDSADTIDGGAGIDLLLTSGTENLNDLLAGSKVDNVEALIHGDADVLNSLLNATDNKLTSTYGITLKGTGTNSNPYKMELTKATVSGETTTNGWAQDGTTYEHHDASGAVDLTMDVAGLMATGVDDTTVTVITFSFGG